MDSEIPSDPIAASDSPETAPLAQLDESIEVTDAVEAVDPVQVARYAAPGLGTPVAKEISPAISHQLPPQFQNIAAKGGAVAALVLGCLSVFGAFVTQWSLFNAVVGLVLGVWGLKSNMFRTAIVGIILCVIGLVLCGAVPAVLQSPVGSP